MRLRRSNYLNDGRGFNQGQPAALIEIERAADYDAILSYIAESDFYGREYLPRRGGQTDDRITAHFWWVAQVVAELRPRRVVELGCGRGDVLRLLREVHGVEVAGIDSGSALPEAMWPSLRYTFHAGDILDVLESWSDAPYDVACGFDIWEHLHPSTLDRTIELLVTHSSDDALFAFVIPAFGPDEVFGEPFPLEFAENREAFERREPFRFLLAESVDERIPAAGHLTWAHTDWWIAKFDAHGLVREPDLERSLHRVFDAHVPHSVRAFYVFRRANSAAQGRVEALHTRRMPALVSLASLLRRRRYERRTGATFTVGLRIELERWAKDQNFPDPLRRLAKAIVGRVDAFRRHDRS